MYIEGNLERSLAAAASVAFSDGDCTGWLVIAFASCSCLPGGEPVFRRLTQCDKGLLEFGRQFDPACLYLTK